MDDEELRKNFLKRAEERHEEGIVKYGDIWKTDDKDWVREIEEELADAVNYLSYLAVRLKRGKEK